MGNEGSIPSSEDSEGFEYEGRSPPSATGPDGQPYVVAGMNMNNNNNDPRLMNGGGNNGSGNNGSGGAAHHHNHHNHHHHHHHESRPGGGGGGRLKGSVFTRRSNAHNQNSTGIERTPSAYAPSSVGSDTSGSSYHTSVNVMPGDDLEYMGRAGQQQQQQQQAQHQHQHQHDLLHQQQLQSYPGGHAQHQYQQQQQQQQQSMYGQQQHQHQQQPQPQYQQHYHHAAQQQTPPNHPHAHPFQQQQQQQQQLNGNNTTKKIRPGQRAGAAIINSMRNLNIGSAMHRIGGVGIGKSPANSPMRGGNSNNNSNSKRQQMHKRQQQQQQQQQQKQQQQQQVNEWEARWDNDSDEEDEDSVQNEGISTHTSSQQQQHPHHPPSVASPPASLQQQAQILRPPEMDAGYMSAVSASPSNPLMVGTALQHQQQQQQMGHHHHSAYSTIATTTDPSVAHAQAQAHAHAQLQTTQQQQQPVHVHVTDDETTNYSAIEGGDGDDDDDDGVEWDTGAAAGNNKAGIPDDDAEVDDGDDDDSKAPNVKQFLPLLRVLGKGSFGKVVLVQKRVGREQGSLFAMKILKKTHLVRRRQIERTRTERKVLSAVNHPFIMKLHYAFQTPEKLYLVLDYCPGGELFFHLSRFRRFPERVARFYAAELLLALGHLHKRGIIYRDLKPENVLLDAEGHVKLGDFGLAKAGIRHAYEGATSMCGTPEYMAPEVLAQQGHGFCVDYWGLGMLTYEMMTGLPPWYTTDRAKLFRRLRSAPLDIPPYFSASSASFSGALLERNPTRRLGVTGIRAAMEHEFFKSISWRALYGRRVEAPIRPCEGWSPPAASGGDESPSNSAHRQQHSLDQSLSSSSPQVQTQTTTTTTTTIPTDLDAATANFDNQFTRMPVETEEDGNAGDDDDMEELHEDTFVGFTFDDNDRDEIEAAQQLKQQQQQQQQSRPRTHHYSREGHQID